MGELIEKMARAIATIAIRDRLGLTDEQAANIAAQRWRGYELEARAALEAALEPTAAMIEAGVGALHGPVGESPYPVARAAWRSMISAELKEP